MDFVTYQMSLSGKSNPFDVSDITKAVKPPVIEEPEKPTEDSTTALNPSETPEQNQTTSNLDADNSTSPATGDNSLLVLFVILGLFL